MKVEEIHSHSEQYIPLQKFVEKNKLLFNTESWLKNYNRDNIVQCAILNKNNEVIGCFMYYKFKKTTFNFIISAPFTPNIDLFFVNPAESVVGANTFNKEISEVLSSYFDKVKAHYINLNLPANIIDTQPFIWNNYQSKHRYSYIINLDDSKEKLWDNLSSEKRKSVNKATKDNLEIKEAQDFKEVYELIIKSLSRNNLAKNTQIIRNILFSFANKQNSFSYIAYHNGMALGATYCLVYKDTAMYLFGGFDSENKHHGAGVSCMWQSILKAKELGLKHFDFEGSMNENIERYFREFGGELIQYACIEKISPILKLALKIKGKQFN